MNKVAVIKATEDQKHIFENLIQLYMYDMSAYYPDWPIQPSGLWEYDMLERFWQHPYLLYANNNLVGFALVINESPLTRDKCWFMAEFFVIKNQRGRGFAEALLKQILEEHQGSWCVSVMENNQIARKFWEKCLPKDASMTTEYHDGDEWKSFRFIA